MSKSEQDNFGSITMFPDALLAETESSNVDNLPQELRNIPQYNVGKILQMVHNHADLLNKYEEVTGHEAIAGISSLST